MPAGSETRVTPAGGQEQVERDDNRKKKKIAAPDAASTSIGTVTTTPFAGEVGLDDIAMPMISPMPIYGLPYSIGGS